jgi:hypothetical protein
MRVARLMDCFTFASPISSDTFLLGVFAAGLALGAGVTRLASWCAR